MTLPADRTLYLSEADVGRLGIDANSALHAVQAAFVSHSRGTLLCEPKSSIGIGAGHAFQSLMAVDVPRGYAGIKWAGVFPPEAGATANINAIILLSAVSTGHLHCVMSARLATAMRTAAMSAVAAQYLARPDSQAIGFVGAGIQAENHLVAMAGVLPKLNTVHICSRTRKSEERMAAFSRALGFETHVSNARHTTASSDVLVTSVPMSPEFVPFLDASSLRPGSFVASVDLGRTWVHSSLASADLLAVDDASLKRQHKPGSFVPPLDRAQATLDELANGRHPGRSNNTQRIMYFSSGTAIADLAIAALIYERALSRSAGTEISL